MNPQKAEQRESLKTTRKSSLRRWSRMGYLFIYFGAISLVSSVLYNSSILAFIGLSLMLWGGLFLFIKSSKHVKATVLYSTTASSFKSMDKILNELNYKGQPVYLPPRQLKELREGVVFVPSEQGIHIPKAERLSEGKTFLNPEGICLTPPGQDLMRLYEKILKTDFSRVNLNYLKNKLPELLVENLEILDDIEIIEAAAGRVAVKMKGEVHVTLCNQHKNRLKSFPSLGCPLCSSMACALARVTDKAVVIEKLEISEKEKTTETWYRLFEEK